MTTFDAEITFSLISVSPAFKYIPEVDAYIACWHGLYMTKTLALALAMVKYKIYITPSMNDAITHEYKTFYDMGVFGDVSWGDSMFYKTGFLNIGYIQGLLEREFKKNEFTFFHNKSLQDVIAVFNIDE